MKYLFLIMILLLSCNSVENGFVDKGALSLKPEIKFSGNQIEFILHTKRNYIVEKEYIPNSEDLKILVYSEKGKLIYNSGEGANFFMAIQDVKPIEVGEKHTYKFISKNDFFDKSKIYKIHYIIPAKPEIYSITLDYIPNE